MILTREVSHGKIAACHELDVHGLPRSRGIGSPRDVARRALVVNAAGARLGRVGVCAHGGKRSEKRGEQDGSEHIKCAMRCVLKLDARDAVASAVSGR